MKASIISKSGAPVPSIAATLPAATVSPGFGSWRLAKEAKPFSASSTANLSSLSGRSSQSEKRFQRLAKLPGSPAMVALVRRTLRGPDYRGYGRGAAGHLRRRAAELAGGEGRFRSAAVWKN